jgi:hypothetical protein
VTAPNILKVLIQHMWIQAYTVFLYRNNYEKVLVMKI